MSRRQGSDRGDDAELDVVDGKRRRRQGLRIPADTVPRPSTVPPEDGEPDERSPHDPALAASIAVSFRDDVTDAKPEPPPARTARLGTEDPFGGRTIVDPLEASRTQELPALRPGDTGHGARAGSAGDSIDISIDEDEFVSGAAPVVAPDPSAAQRAATMALSDDEIEELMVESRLPTPQAMRSRAERATDLPAAMRVDSTTELQDSELIEARGEVPAWESMGRVRAPSDEFDSDDDDDEVEVTFGDPIEVGAAAASDIAGAGAQVHDPVEPSLPSARAGGVPLTAVAQPDLNDSGEVTVLSPDDAESIDEDLPDDELAQSLAGPEADEPEDAADAAEIEADAVEADEVAEVDEIDAGGMDEVGETLEAGESERRADTDSATDADSLAAAPQVAAPLGGGDSGEILTADILEEEGDARPIPPPPPTGGASGPAAAGKGPPPAPAVSKAPDTPATAPGAKAKRKGKPWFEEVFDEDYLRTLPFLTPHATQAEAQFVAASLGLEAGAQILDVGCGYGRHAMEFAARGYHVVGLDSSLPLLLRGADEAQRRSLDINFVHGDMREMEFEAQFDGAYCLFSTFGYFDDETNKQTAQSMSRALKPGARLVIEVLNRDYLVADLPTRVWWEGDGCVVLEEVDFNYFSSRVVSNRSVVFDDGRQVEQEISIRAYSLHEIGKLLHASGFRVVEISGSMAHRGRFFGGNSRQILVVAEKRHKRGETLPDSRS